MRSKLIFDVKVRLVFGLEVLVGTPVLVEDACGRIAHDGVLGFVRALEDALQGPQLFRR